MYKIHLLCGVAHNDNAPSKRTYYFKYEEVQKEKAHP